MSYFHNLPRYNIPGYSGLPCSRIVTPSTKLRTQRGPPQRRKCGNRQASRVGSYFPPRGRNHNKTRKLAVAPCRITRTPSTQIELDFGLSTVAIHVEVSWFIDHDSKGVPIGIVPSVLCTKRVSCSVFLDTRLACKRLRHCLLSMAVSVYPRVLENRLFTRVMRAAAGKLRPFLRYGCFFLCFF